MFFNISTQQHQIEHPLSQSYQVNNFFCQLDQGWKKHGNIFYKGYCIDQQIDVKVHNKDFSSEKGNYVILDLTSNFKIYFDDTRGFPLYYTSDTVHNIPTNINECYDEVYYDGTVTFKNNQFSFVFCKDKKISYDETRNFVSTEYLVDWICEYLVDSASKIKTDLPIYACDSNGVDSTLVQSAFDYVGREYTKVKIQDNKVNLSMTTCYKELYTGDFKAHLQLTGWAGDEYILRNPLYCHWLLKAQNINLINEYNKREYCYMKGFFENKYLEKLKNDDYKFKTYKDAFNHIANVAINDNQMWHFDNIITFTPFQNTNVLETMLYADCDAIIAQVTDAEISKKAIAKLNPAKLQKISVHKNNYKPTFGLDYEKV